MTIRGQARKDNSRDGTKKEDKKKKMELKEKLKETSCKGDERLKGKSQEAQKNMKQVSSKTNSKR